MAKTEAKPKRPRKPKAAPASSSYAAFLDRRVQLAGGHGFEPTFVPAFLKDFQAHLVEWTVRRGRGAVFAACGMGKTPIHLVVAENVVRRTNKPFLITTPLAVAHQFVTEGTRFGVDVFHSRDGKVPAGARVVVTNVQRLHLFDPRSFAGCGMDESSGLKDCDSATRDRVTEFMRMLPYRVLASATPSPNDYTELGTSAEALGELGHQDMLTRFFRQTTEKDRLGWGRVKYKMRGHAAADFWRWATSWSRACRRPSDLGYDDAGYALPELVTREHTVKASRPEAGRLFDVPAVTLQEEQEEQRRTIRERCEKAAELAAGHPVSVAWCHLNAEGDLLAKLIPGAVQVSGSDPEEAKEEKLIAFAAGQIKKLVTKPALAGYGLNWQHCGHQTYFPSHSWERWHQCVHRSVRFGRTAPVVVDVVSTEGSAGVLDNLKRKSGQAEAMFAELVRLMNDSLKIGRTPYGAAKEEVPAWLS